MHEIDTWMFYKWTIKAVIAIYFVTNTFDIVMGIFDVAQHMVNASASRINTNTSIDITSSVTAMVNSLSGKSVAELTTIALETAVCQNDHVSHHYPYHGNSLWKDDRNLLDHFCSSHPFGNNGQQGMESGRDKLH